MLLSDPSIYRDSTDSTSSANAVEKDHPPITKRCSLSSRGAWSEVHRLLNSERTSARAVVPTHLRGTRFGIATSDYRCIMIDKR